MLCLTALAACGPSLQTVRHFAERGQLQNDAPIMAEAVDVIDAPIEIVWELFSAIDCWPEWNDDATGAKSSGPFAAGTSFSYGTGTRHELNLAVVKPRTQVVFYGTFAGYKGITRWEFQEFSPGRTRASVRESNDGPLISLFYSKAKLERHLVGWVTALKAAAERRDTKSRNVDASGN